MAKLTEYTRYVDARRCADSQALWDLFDGNREYLNIAHECVTRHPDGSGRAAVRIVADADLEKVRAVARRIRAPRLRA
jgi:acetyl-CoA synthetase